MNKKIKVIDIFNIISKGDYEALPLNIQVDGNKYNWDNLEHFYGREDRDDEDLLELARVYDTVTFLDMNVEVLDNNLKDNTEEIEEIKEISDEYFNMLSDESKVKWLKSYIKENRNKINELVRAVKKLQKEREDKQ